MHAMLLLIASTMPAVDYGWQPGPDGQMEYIIQIEPELIGALRDGAVVVSEIHPDAQNVRRFRIQLGTGELPRVTSRSALDPTLPTNHEVVAPAPSVPASRAPVLERFSTVGSAPIGSAPSRFSPPNTAANATAPRAEAPPTQDRFAAPPPASRDTSLDPRFAPGPHQREPVYTQPLQTSNGAPAATPQSRFGAPTAETQPTNSAATESQWVLPDRNEEPYVRPDWTRFAPAGTEPRVAARNNDRVSSPAPRYNNSGQLYNDLGQRYGDPGRDLVSIPPAERQPDNRATQPLWPAPVQGYEASARFQGQPATPANNRFGAVPTERTAVTAIASRNPGVSVAAAPNTNTPVATPHLVPLAPVGTQPATAPAPLPTPAPVATVPAETPWVPFVVVMLGLFASLSGNAYLGWISYGAVMRYRDLVAELTIERRTA